MGNFKMCKYCPAMQAENCPNDYCDEHCQQLCKHEQEESLGTLTRTEVADFARAWDAFDKCLEENEPRHKGAWREQSVVTHLEHADAHLKAWKKTHQNADLVSLFVRCGMALENLLRFGVSTQSEPPAA